MALYESEHTKFMREMMARHPEWIEDQRRGRGIWWDRKIDLNETGSVFAKRLKRSPRILTT